MIFSETNFLPDDVFTELCSKTTHLRKLSKFEQGRKEITVEEKELNLGLNHGVYNTEHSLQEALRFRFWCNGDDVFEETANFFGPHIRNVLDHTKNYLIERGWPNIKLSNVWFQYGDPKTEMHRHSDGKIHGAEWNNCFTSMIFSHSEEWHDEWGGVFSIAPVPTNLADQINETVESFSPQPNSFVIWNRDHPHWMTPIVRDDIPIRQFIGMSWYEK